MNLIVAVDNNWGIGYNNNLLVSIPADKKFFKNMTIGKTIIMGRKTLESFPGGAPLAGRNNIVITSKKNYNAKGAYVVHDIDEAIKRAHELSADDDIFVVGGGRVYADMLDMCKKAYITKVDYTYSADTFFPNIEKKEHWKLESESEEQTCFDIVYSFCTYTNLLLEKE